MYALRGNAPDFTFGKNNSLLKVTVWSGMSGNGILLGTHFLLVMQTTTPNLDILKIFALPQLQDFFRHPV